MVLVFFDLQSEACRSTWKNRRRWFDNHAESLYSIRMVQSVRDRLVSSGGLVRDYKRFNPFENREWGDDRA